MFTRFFSPPDNPLFRASPMTVMSKTSQYTDELLKFLRKRETAESRMGAIRKCLFVVTAKFCTHKICPMPKMERLLTESQVLLSQFRYFREFSQILGKRDNHCRTTEQEVSLLTHSRLSPANFSQMCSLCEAMEERKDAHWCLDTSGDRGFR